MEAIEMVGVAREDITRMADDEQIEAEVEDRLTEAQASAKGRSAPRHVLFKCLLAAYEQGYLDGVR